jgi:membrane protease YdiL (CAAX protease family)
MTDSAPMPASKPAPRPAPVSTLNPRPAGAREPGVWNVWLTLAWMMGGFVVLIAAQLIAVVVFFVAGFVDPAKFLADPMSLEKDPVLLGMAQVISTPFVLLYFVLAARAAKLKASDYLALKWPRAKHFVIGLAAIVAASITADLISVAVGHEVTSTFMNDIFFAAKEPWVMVLLGAGVVIMAPLQEEIAFRGFMFPGVAKSWGPWPAIIVVAALWASMHVQYDWYFITQVFAMGVLLGWLRWWSGSTLLVIVLHAAVNGAAVAQAWLLTSAN